LPEKKSVFLLKKCFTWNNSADYEWGQERCRQSFPLDSGALSNKITATKVCRSGCLAAVFISSFAFALDSDVA